MPKLATTCYAIFIELISMKVAQTGELLLLHYHIFLTKINPVFIEISCSRYKLMQERGGDNYQFLEYILRKKCEIYRSIFRYMLFNSEFV
jgi:hypothetical protein